MKSIVLILSILFSMTSCSDNENIICEDTTIIDNQQYTDAQSDNYTLISLNNHRGCLKVSIRYGGGCKEVSVKLIDSEEIFESNPIQRNLKIVLTDNDECEALIENNFYFDISDLQVNNESKVLLNFQGSDLTYLYEY